MANHSIRLDLLKVPSAFVTNIRGRATSKKCLVIPIEDSGLFLGEKGCYLNLNAYELRNPQFEETHCVKIAIDRQRRATMTDEQLRAIPIIGGMRDAAPQLQRQMGVNLSSDVESPEDMPF